MANGSAWESVTAYLPERIFLATAIPRAETVTPGNYCMREPWPQEHALRAPLSSRAGNTKRTRYNKCHHRQDLDGDPCRPVKLAHGAGDARSRDPQRIATSIPAVSSEILSTVKFTLTRHCCWP